jgi:hypothetical protein
MIKCAMFPGVNEHLASTCDIILTVTLSSHSQNFFNFFWAILSRLIYHWINYDEVRNVSGCESTLGINLWCYFNSHINISLTKKLFWFLNRLQYHWINYDQVYDASGCESTLAINLWYHFNNIHIWHNSQLQ